MSTPPTDPPDQLPEALAERLRGLDGPTPFVPAETDAAVLERAAAHLGAVRRRRRRFAAALAVPGAGAAAAAIVLGLWVANTFGPAPPPAATVQTARGVTILDAFALARRRAAGDTSVTQAQIDRLARQAVRLDGPTGAEDAS